MSVNYDPVCWRAACAVHSQFPEVTKLPRLTKVEREQLADVDRALRGLVLASQRGWDAAAERSRLNARIALGRLQQASRSLHDQLAPALPGSLPSVRDLHDDLVALRSEFPELKLDSRQRQIQVTTESIVLEGIDLGPFQIQLDWTELGHDVLPDYRVVALEPNPAGTQDNVTHPHVQDDILCEGEGRTAIGAAIRQARVFDFFLLVAGLLRTYNAESPYVPLCHWHGAECMDCGRLAAADDRSCCASCEADLCDDCGSTCSICSDGLCAECSKTCPVCDDDCCATCQDKCIECGRLVCRDCIHSERRCSTCEDNDSTEDEKAEEPADSAPALLTDSVGEAAVPA